MRNKAPAGLCSECGELLAPGGAGEGGPPGPQAIGAHFTGSQRGSRGRNPERPPEEPQGCCAQKGPTLAAVTVLKVLIMLRLDPYSGSDILRDEGAHTGAWSLGSRLALPPSPPGLYASWILSPVQPHPPHTHPRAAGAGHREWLPPPLAGGTTAPSLLQGPNTSLC